MSLSRFPKAMAENVEAVIRTAAALRHVTSSSGDLLFQDIRAIQSGLEQSKLTFLAALQEGQKSATAAEAFMVSINGPSTLAAYQKGAGSIENAAASWNARLSQALSEMTSADLIKVVIRPDTQTKHVEWAAFIPALVADPLRQSVDLADLIEAFAALGG